MTGNKRFILKENNVIDDTELNILLDGGEDSEDMVDLLNELHEENTTIRQTIKEAIQNERTQIGKSVLKQLLNNME